MTFVTSLSLPLQNLVVIVVRDPLGKLIAYGVNPSTQQFPFITEVANLGEFLQGLVDPTKSDLVKKNSIVVPVKPPATPWPDSTVVIALARSLSTDQQLAQLSTQAA